MLAGKKVHNQVPHRQSPPHMFRQVVRYILKITFFVLVCLFLSWRPIRIARLTRDIGQLQKLKAEMIEINARLKLEKATLSCLDRIEEKARRGYGFIDPDREQVIDFFIKNFSSRPQ